jgi:adenylate cyclase
VSQTRRLAAILAADVAGYSRLMGADEEGTLERLKALRRELLDPKIAEHHGRIVKTTGDGLLVEFASVVDAVRCAVAVQQAMPERNTGIGADNRIELRIGINLSDVIVEGDDLYGDGVNIAARIEVLADPGGVFVSNMVHDHVRDRLPFVFEDLGEQQVKNIARPVRVYRVRTTLTHPAADAPGSPLSRIAGEGAERQRREAGEGGPPLALPDKPSIAVLRFANLSGDPEQEYFADGMVEEIITALSRIRWLFVIARNSSFTYKGQAVDVKQVGRELGVRYVVEGSVRKGGNRVRITAQLIDAMNGAHLWADRFDGSLEDIFELQDKVAIAIAGIIEPTLQSAEMRRSADRPTADLTAYDLYLRALSLRFDTDREGVLSALDLLGRAIERDPHYAPALACAALCHLQLHVTGWSADLDREKGEGVSLARRALQVTRDDPGVLVWSGYVLAYFGEDIDAAIELTGHALTLNPSFAHGWYWNGWLRLWAGQTELAISHFETCLRLSPHFRAHTFLGIGIGYFFSRRFGEAVAMLPRTLQEHPGWPPTYRFLAACYAHMGRLDDARSVIERLRAITPLIVPKSAMQWRNPEHRELYLSGLRLAAGEET